ncbi:concanavalin A-like lectin/glucanase domain-containing protein [Fennellomyces sp. T-0311]|nr:concanavalin A-like lectin/glucanase domain-containing protein [Fennellomyces sp. T-0311]
MNLRAPSQYERLIHAATLLPYNSHIGRGPTFNSTTYMQYGKFSATIKSSPIGGAITAVILIADGGDEIDFELIGSERNTAQTNYFWGEHPIYTINGGFHNVSGGPIYDGFHTYHIDWSPERIVWTIDEDVVRVKHRNETCEGSVCKFPSHPARVQIGFWDGSFEFGTAEWSHGPINWEMHTADIASYLKEVRIECDPEYNQIVDSLPGDSEPIHATDPNEGEQASPEKWKPKSEEEQEEKAVAAASNFIIPCYYFLLLSFVTLFAQ